MSSLGDSSSVPDYSSLLRQAEIERRQRHPTTPPRNNSQSSSSSSSSPPSSSSVISSPYWRPPFDPPGWSSDPNLKPSETPDTLYYFLYAQQPPHVVPAPGSARFIDRSRVGKWMLFKSPDWVDWAWDKVKQGVQDGAIWSAKVSTKPTESSAYYNPNKPSQHVVIVYTVDYENIDDVVRVLNWLDENKLKGKNYSISYKTDDTTRAGVYGPGASLYTSKKLRERYPLPLHLREDLSGNRMIDAERKPPKEADIQCGSNSASASSEKRKAKAKEKRKVKREESGSSSEEDSSGSEDEDSNSVESSENKKRKSKRAKKESGSGSTRSISDAEEAEFQRHLALALHASLEAANHKPVQAGEWQTSKVKKSKGNSSADAAAHLNRGNGDQEKSSGRKAESTPVKSASSSQSSSINRELDPDFNSDVIVIE